MRVIAGTAKGRRLAAPETRDTRPVTDRVKEAVFSSIGGWVVDADVADLYAGAGSFGLEALSRGARSAVFVENGARALTALKKNIGAVGLGGEVSPVKVRQFLEANRKTFHLVFVDPPWPLSTEDLEADFALLDRFLEDEAEVVASRRHTDRVPVPPENWRVATEKRYGDTRIVRYEKKAEAQ
ncbi:MAG: 16S rRNA (guanine(966)-N(2))-methyltransferase RsmD [Acidimicrobiia bacterium]